LASLGHIAVAFAAARAHWRRGERFGRTAAVLSALSMAPDVDVVGMRLGVPYGAPWGHRGATHSIAVALVAAAAVTWLMRDSPRWRFFGLVAAAVAVSHGLLDAMTDGGRGVALLWPWTSHRFFLPWRPIPVAPIGAGLLSTRGLSVMAWEAVAFAPAWAFALWPRREHDDR
jgi:inner membrane protein